jgi:hypothetical protein
MDGFNRTIVVHEKIITHGDKLCSTHCAWHSFDLFRGTGCNLFKRVCQTLEHDRDPLTGAPQILRCQV